MNDRELDALVAKTVMNFKYMGTHKIAYSDAPVIEWRIPCRGPSKWRYKEFLPTTKMGDAWDVVEKMRAKEMDFDLYAPSWAASCKLQGGNWKASFDHFSGVADTAPRAICLAALEAVGEKV